MIERPTPEDRALAAAADELTPEKSLARAEETAKFVFGNVAVVGTVLAGVGLTTDAGSAWERGPHVLGVPLTVMLVAVALVLATLALLPTLRSLNLVDLATVRRFYRGQLIRRGGCALLAMIALGAAIAAAVATASNEQGPSHTLALSGAITGSAQRSTVSASATIGGLKQSDVLFISVYGETMRGGSTLVCRAAGSPTPNGAATVSCPALAFSRLARLKIEGSVQRGGATIKRRSLLLSR